MPSIIAQVSEGGQAAMADPWAFRQVTAATRKDWPAITCSGCEQAHTRSGRGERLHDPAKAVPAFCPVIRFRSATVNSLQGAPAVKLAPSARSLDSSVNGAAPPGPL